MNWPSFIKSQVLPLLVVAALVAYVSNTCTRSGYIAPEKVDMLLDEQTRVHTAEIQSLEHILGEIEESSAAMADRIREQNERIVSFTRIEAELRITEDSLDYYRSRPARRVRDFVTLDPAGAVALKDTTIIESRTFTQGLFRVSCTVSLNPSGCFTITPELQQLRPIRIEHTIALQPSGHVNSYVHIPDFDMELTEVESFQPPVQQQKSWWDKNGKSVVLTTGATVAVIQAVRILFGG